MGKLGKHDHKLTNILKACIFSLIMLAPLIAIGVRCLYVINNKNAYESYSDVLVDKTFSLNSSNFNDLYVQNQEIHWVYDENITFATASGWFGFKTISVDFNELLGTQNINYVAFKFYTSDWNIIQVIDSNNISRNLQNPLTHFKELTWVADLTTYTTKSVYNYGNAYIITYKQITLDNVFEYSVKQLEQQNTFNWVQNTAIYVPLNAMCSGLGITESAIPILLCYWSLMTAIYIVFDIIIYLFTKLTHLIGTN